MKYVGNRTHPFEYEGKMIASQDEIDGDPSNPEIAALLDRGWIVTATPIPAGASEDSEVTTPTKKSASKRGGE